MKLIKDLKPKSIEDFIELYYRSGEERKKLIKDKKLPQELTNPDELWQMVMDDYPFSKEEFQVNNNYGRNEEFIKNISLHFAAISKIKEEEAEEQVKQRIFIDTFNGYEYELLALNYLKKKYGNRLKFEQTNGETDSKYAVDILATKDNKVVAGIQIKPSTYFKKENSQTKDNVVKNNLFIRDYRAPVIYYAYSFKCKNMFVCSHQDENLLLNLAKDFS